MKWTVISISLLAGITLVACGPNNRGDNFGTDGHGSNGSNGSNGSGGDGCSAASKLVYVVDQNNKLSQFDPTSKAFTDLGTLTCPAGSGFQPFSMGVDRNATAYVLYVNQQQNPITGEITILGTKLFKVDTTSTTLPCTATTFNAGNLKEFGMGFSTTTAGGDADQLFIAGGSNVNTTSTSSLNTLDVTSYAAMSVGNVNGSPELTGNSNAELWGFFPDPTSPKIAQINKASGTTTDHALTDTSFKGTPLAWAFAFYGGDYWVFLMKDPDPNDLDGSTAEKHTTVYQVSDTGMLKGMTDAPNRVIVGAGVSTCAPVVIE